MICQTDYESDAPWNAEHSDTSDTWTVETVGKDKEEVHSFEYDDEAIAFAKEESAKAGSEDVEFGIYDGGDHHASVSIDEETGKVVCIYR